MAAVPRGRPDQARILVAALLLLLSAACGGSGKGSASGHPKQTASASPSTPSDGPLKPQDIVKAGGDRIQGVTVDWMQVVDGAPWGAAAGGALVRLDPVTGRQTARVKTRDDTCTAMDTRGAELFAAVCSSPGEVVRVDSRSAKITRVFKLGQHLVQDEGSIAVDGRYVWVVTGDERRVLLGVDLRTGKIAKNFRIPQDVTAVRAGFGDLWLTDPEHGVLLRMDPGSGRVLARIPTGAGARFFAVGEGAVWVQNNEAGTVSRVDPKTNRQTASIDVSPYPVDGGDLAVGGGSVWGRISDALVARIDPSTNKVVARYGPQSGSGSVAADARAVWISAHDVSSVFRLPLR
jgi:virginiamycin B lyase